MKILKKILLYYTWCIKRVLHTTWFLSILRLQIICKQAFIAFTENTKCLWFLFTNTLFELEKAQEKSPVFLSAWDKSVKIPGSFHLD